MKNKRLLDSLELIDEKYIKEAEPKMTVSTSTSGKLITRIASVAVILILGLYLFFPLKSKPKDLSKYADSEYYPLIAAIDGYTYKPKTYKNNFSRIINNFNFGFTMKDAGAPESNMSASGSNKYVETTDNQVDGVIEADLLKRTETHAFRLGKNALRVYTVTGKDSKEIAKLDIPLFSGEYNTGAPEMYLSLDGKTVTVIKQYTEKNEDRYTTSKVGIISIDVSNPQAPFVKKQISIDGAYNSSRMVNGQLLLISSFSLKQSSIDYENPETFVPTITDGNTKRCIEFKDIFFPEKLNNLSYSVVSLFDENSLNILGANALLCYNSTLYVSKDNVYAVRDYSMKGSFDGSDSQDYFKNLSDILILRYSDGTLENKGTVTVDGSIRDQYSMDEYNGHLRVVTSTNDRIYNNNEAYKDKATELLSDKRESASLTVFNLDTLAKVAEVVDFAPEGEEAMSVRFDGETAYVCTAIVVKITDPVYYFDLSDYDNITYTDTGVIDGYSTSLIQLGDGILLGIGVENNAYNKVEVYEEINGKVEGVDKYLFSGEYSTEYKSYFINREYDLFGFAESCVRVKENYNYTHKDYYVLLAYNGYEIVEIARIEIGNGKTDPSRIRAFMVNDYLYITDDESMKVFLVSEE